MHLKENVKGIIMAIMMINCILATGFAETYTFVPALILGGIAWVLLYIYIKYE